MNKQKISAIEAIIFEHFKARPTGEDCKPFAHYSVFTRDSALSFYDPGYDYNSVEFWMNYAPVAYEKAELEANVGEEVDVYAFMERYLDFVDAVRSYDYEQSQEN